MNTRTRIKICGLTREEDVDAAVQAGVDAVGFVLYPPSPRAISAQRAAELAKRLPPMITPVLLFVNEEQSKIVATLLSVTCSVAQFHGDESPWECQQAAQAAGTAFWRAARIPVGEHTPAFDLPAFVQANASAQAILLDAHVQGYGGQGQRFDWLGLPDRIEAHVILSGGLTPDNVAQGIAQVRHRCKTLSVDVSSGVEIAKGIKDPEKIRQFVAAVRQADSQLGLA